MRTGLLRPIVADMAIIAKSLSGIVAGSHAQEELDAAKYFADTKVRKIPVSQRASLVVRWNRVARDLVKKHAAVPLIASRVYALLSVTQADALCVVEELQGRPRMDRTQTAQSRDSAVGSFDQKVISTASRTVLAHLYPEDSEYLASVQDETVSGFDESGEAVGREVARQVIQRAKSDGHDLSWSGVAPKGSGVWSSWLGQPPLLPAWQSVRPWVLRDAKQVLLPPPPRIDSLEFTAALAEVRRISDTRTTEQRRIAEYWADAAGTYTPPGRWNEIAEAMILEHHFNRRESARVFALLNIAMMDAGIAAWYNKYHYWLARPSQMDPAITLPIGLPNFPAYPSGHAAFSGAAAAVLSEVFPQEAAALQAMAEEAAASRVYGGIHYRFDGEQGLVLGRRIATVVSEWEASR